MVWRTVGVDGIESNLQGGVERGKVTDEEHEATLERISTTTALADAVGGADLVIEAVPEDPSLKESVFADIEAAAPRNIVVGTNTSSLSVTGLASALERPERAVGLHFFNPPHVMGLLEVVLAEQTSDAVEPTAIECVERLGKEAVVVRDSAGFASSRLGVALGWRRSGWSNPASRASRTSTPRWRRGTATRWGR